jgi:hypothetical protein
MTIRERLTKELDDAFDEGNTKRLWSLATDLLACVKDSNFPEIALENPVVWGWLFFPYEFQIPILEAVKNIVPDIIPDDNLELCMRREAVQNLRYELGIDTSVDRCEFTRPVIEGAIVSIEIKSIKQ